MIFAQNARILHKNCPKNFFPEFHVPPAPPVSYAYGLENGSPNGTNVVVVGGVVVVIRFAIC